MPQVGDLPENLQALSRRNGIAIKHDSFHRDMARLTRELEGALEEAEEIRTVKAQKVKEELEGKEKTAREVTTRAVKERSGVSQNSLGIEWIKIPAGRFTMGKKSIAPWRDHKPAHEVYLGSYFVGQTPVTNSQYGEFMQAGGYKDERYWSEKGWGWCLYYGITQPTFWDDHKYNSPDHPVVGVSWYEAHAFCKWAGCRLLTEAEWEKAARGTDGYLYPWGNEMPRTSLANFYLEMGTTYVGKYSPMGDSPYGCVDMSGNVWEWTSSLRKKYPYDPKDGREDTNVDGARVIRGGSWNTDENLVGAFFRGKSDPSNSDSDLGFRCAMDAD